MKKLRIIVSGYIGLFPSGGVTWDYIQYPLGLHLLGHDVYYIEDTMQYSRFQSEGKSWDDSSDSIQYLKETMEKFGLGDRWAYRDIASGKWFGIADAKRNDIFKTADVFLNISESIWMRDEYLNIPVRILLDSDPMFTQVQYWNDDEPEKSREIINKRFSNYSHLFSFGENINAGDCRIPTYGLKWQVTRQPVCLDYWQQTTGSPDICKLSSVMNWSTREKMIYQGEEWGQKDVEFEKFIDLPAKFHGALFELLVTDSSKKLERQRLTEAGWVIRDPLQLVRNTDEYQSYIESSCAEFSVAKETYVKSNSGWFSCRSACYLAMGRPVITQDTKWSRYLPSGNGLFAFNDTAGALQALQEITGDYKKHAIAARKIAEDYFDSYKVLNEMISCL